MARKSNRKKQQRRRAQQQQQRDPQQSQRSLRLALLLATSVGVLLLLFLFLRTSRMANWSDELIMRFAATRLSQTDKAALQERLARLVPGLWMPVPEPAVGYRLQPGIRKPSKGTTIFANRAGMRSHREFTSKGNSFRIAVLGDSMVMGTGGAEEDRWGDQMESILDELGVRVEGRPIEVYSLALDGWTALNSATYLTSRFTAYQPDIVIAMMFNNDITDSGGILGNGVLTYGFTPEHREDASGVMIGAWPNLFGLPTSNLLHLGLGTESVSRWQTTFAAWKRLEDLVLASGGRFLFTLMGNDSLMAALSRHHLDEAGVASPFLRTRYFGNSLPHDPHPNAEGHRIVATHLLHAMAEWGWLPVDRSRLPALDSRLSLDSVPADLAGRVGELQAELVGRVLSPDIAFDQLSRDDVRAILGGIYPGSARDRLTTRPFGTPRAAFLLATDENAESVAVRVDVPARPELFPFRLDLQVNGRPASSLALERVDQAGPHTIDAALQPEDLTSPALEVVLTTSNYWTEIEDDVTRSYRLVAVNQIRR